MTSGSSWTYAWLDGLPRMLFCHLRSFDWQCRVLSLCHLARDQEELITQRWNNDVPGTCLAGGHPFHLQVASQSKNELKHIASHRARSQAGSANLCRAVPLLWTSFDLWRVVGCWIGMKKDASFIFFLLKSMPGSHKLWVVTHLVGHNPPSRGSGLGHSQLTLASGWLQIGSLWMQ